MMFWGLTSRCMMPLLWQKSRACIEWCLLWEVQTNRTWFTYRSCWGSMIWSPHCPGDQIPELKLRYQWNGFGGWIPDHFFELNDARVLFERFENLDLSFDFAFFDWLEHLDDNILVVGYRDAHVDLRVFSLAYFGDYFVAIDVTDLMRRYPYSIS